MLRRLHLIVFLTLVAMAAVFTVQAQERTTIVEQLGSLFGGTQAGARARSSQRYYQQQEQSQQSNGYRPRQTSKNHSSQSSQHSKSSAQSRQSAKQRAPAENYENPNDEPPSIPNPPTDSSTRRTVTSGKPTYGTTGNGSRPTATRPGYGARPGYDNALSGAKVGSSAHSNQRSTQGYSSTGSSNGDSPVATSSARSRLGRPTSPDARETSSEGSDSKDPDLSRQPFKNAPRTALSAPFANKVKRPGEVDPAVEEDNDAPESSTNSSRRVATRSSGSTSSGNSSAGGSASQTTESSRRTTDKGIGKAIIADEGENFTSRHRDNAPLLRGANETKPYQVSQPSDALREAFRDRPSSRIGSLIPPGESAKSIPTPPPTEIQPKELPGTASSKPVVEPIGEEGDDIVVKPKGNGTESPKGLANVLFRSAGPALTVETIGPKHVLVGEETSYKFVAQNMGDVAAKNATVNLKIPSWVDVSQTRASKGSAQVGSRDKNIDWSLERLEPGARAELEVKLIPRANQPLELEVQWNSGSAASQASIEVREAKLELAVSGPKEVDFGETVIYEMTFSNPGNAPAEKVVVRLAPLDSSQAPESHDIGTVPAGGRKTVEIELVARHAGRVKVKAEATAVGGLKADVEHEVLVRRADIEVQIDGPKFRYARTTATYNVAVRNPGTGIARAVNCSIDLPRGATYLSGIEGANSEEGQLTWTIDILRPGDQSNYTVKCELANPGPNRMQVYAAGDGNLRDTSYVSTDVEAVADLVLEVHDPKGPVAVGEDTPYEVTIRNRGTKAAENVELKAFFSDGVEPTALEGAEGRVEPGKVVLQPIGSIAPGDQRQIKIIARATRPGNHVFQAELECPDLDARLSAQETTRFYGDNDNENRPTSPAKRLSPGKPDRSALEGGTSSESRGSAFRAAEPTPVDDKDN